MHVLHLLGCVPLHRFWIYGKVGSVIVWQNGWQRYMTSGIRSSVSKYVCQHVTREVPPASIACCVFQAHGVTQAYALRGLSPLLPKRD